MFSSNTTQVSSGGYEIQRSLRFNSADTAQLSRTPASASNRKTWTWSAWIKRSAISNLGYPLVLPNGNSDSTWSAFAFYAADTFVVEAWTFNYFVSTAVYRDPSAWYHVVVAWDTTQATNTDRLKVYVNGVAATGTYTYPAQNFDGPINSAVLHRAGNFNGYMTEVNFIDGQALTPSSFGEYNADTGVWQPKRYAGSYGTNGFYLNFSNNSNTTAATLGADYSGNGNNWTPNNFSVSAGAGNDSLVDVPTNWGVDTGVGGTVRGNYCTLNPLASKNGFGANGNLDGTVNGSEPNYILGTIAVSSGKWYWEWTPTSNLIYSMVGITLADSSTIGWLTPNSWAYWYTGSKYNNNTAASYGASFALNDIIGIALDMDAGTVTFYKNGVSQGTAYSGLTGSIVPYFGSAGGGVNAIFTANFGQRPFAYTAPSGFKALNTQNLPTPTIGATSATQAGKFFNPVLYTGNNTTQSITGVGFQPDLVWVKSRSSTTNHVLIDVLRGVSRWLGSNDTAAEFNSPGDFVTAFNSDGFSVGPLGGVNSGSTTYVGWNWKANGAGVTNTAGSITSTVSANTTSGFSVVTFTGGATAGTVGHGLGAAPQMIVVKRRNGTGDWYVYHQAIGNTRTLLLQATNGQLTTTVWNNTSPTSSVFTFLDSSGATYVAYAFSEVPGYSKFGSYVGNGSNDGPFVFTGFKPAYVLIKRTTGTDDWRVFDNRRSGYNVNNDSLYPNDTYPEDSGSFYTYLDLLSNGFKIRTSVYNNSGDYIFAAFAEAPQKFSLAR
jgi:hypothetical protein